MKGKKIYENGVVFGYDEKAIVHELQELHGEFKERFAVTVKENDVLMPYINQIYKKSVDMLGSKGKGQNLFS